MRPAVRAPTVRSGTGSELIRQLVASLIGMHDDVRSIPDVAAPGVKTKRDVMPLLWLRFYLSAGSLPARYSQIMETIQ